jgi:hypothetical protein
LNPLAGIAAIGAALAVAKLTDKHSPKFAVDNDFYWLEQDGSYGSRKPLSFGPRTWHMHGRPLVPKGVEWVDWPEGEDHLVFASKEDVLDARQEIGERWIESIKSSLKIDRF